MSSDLSCCATDFSELLLPNQTLEAGCCDDKARLVGLQLSVLRVFQAVLTDKGFRKQDGAGEVVQLATHITRNLCARLVPDSPYDGNHQIHLSRYQMCLRNICTGSTTNEGTMVDVSQHSKYCMLLTHCACDSRSFLQSIVMC